MRPSLRALIGLLLLFSCIAACSPVPVPPPGTPIALLPPATLPPPASAASATSTARQIAGNDADESQAKLEPHYDVITAAEQVQIYEPVMPDSNGNLTYTLIRAATYLKDNRLLPQRFDKEAAPADVAVYGEATRRQELIASSPARKYRRH